MRTVSCRTHHVQHSRRQALEFIIVDEVVPNSGPPQINFDLIENASFRQHDDAIRQKDRFGHVMCDENHRRSPLLPDARQFLLQNIMQVCASTLAKGSSINRTAGLLANARTTPTRCCIPPDNSLRYTIRCMREPGKRQILPSDPGRARPLARRAFLDRSRHCQAQSSRGTMRTTETRRRVPDRAQ